MSEQEQNKDRRRGIIGTVVFHTALLILFIFLGLTYYEPKPEEGIVINFGNSETGMGDQADGAQQPQAQPSQPQTTTETEETPTDNAENPIQTQNVTDAPAVEKKRKKPVEKKKPTPEELEQQRQERERQEKQRQLDERFGKVSDAKAGGEGEKQGAGDQGDPSGDPNSTSRTGGANGGNGSGGTGNYLLSGRKALSKPAPDYACADEGRVVVKIYVDRNGAVTQAIPGEKVPGGAATTTTSSCLYDRAKAAATRTTWQGDADAPALQIGYIIYNFTKR